MIQPGADSGEAKATDQPDPPDADKWVERGLARLGKGEADGAFEDFERATRLDPSNILAHLGRGRARLSRGEHASAIRDFDQALRLNPDDAHALGFRATSRHLKGDYAGAVADFDRALSCNPTVAWLYNGRGASLHSLEDYRAAIADYTRALVLDPDGAEAYRNRGLARLVEDESEAAISDFSEAIRVGLEDVRNYLHRAEARHAVGDDEGAVVDYGEAIRLDPDLVRAYRGRAQSLEALGRDEEAEADHDRAECLEDEDSPAEDSMTERKAQIDALIRSHFEPTMPEDLTITERLFPHRVRADLQRAVDRSFGEGMTVSYFCGVRKRHNYEGVSLTELLVRDRHDPAQAVPPLHEEVDVGGDEPVRCLKNGLWLLESETTRFVVFLEQHSHYGRMNRLRVQVATVNNPTGFRVTQGFFEQLEEAVERAESYRGKILSLEDNEQ